MKILFITGLHPEQGNPASGIFLTRRIKKLSERGFQYDLYFFSEKSRWYNRIFRKVLRRPKFSYCGAIEVEGVQYKPLPVVIGFWDMVFFHQRIGKVLVDAINKNLNLRDYDLIHAHWVYPHGYIASIIKTELGMPCIVSAHGSDIHTNPLKNSKCKKAVVFSLETADKVIFNNQKLKQTAKTLGYSGNNSNVIYNGVETDLFIPMNKEKARRDLGLLPLDARFVGYIGNLKWVKRADRLPAIFNEIKRKNSRVKFIVIGDGKYRKKIEKECKAYNLEVKFTGRVDPENVPVWMSAIDVLILPSRNEGFPNVCIESQSCGCPVVGSNVGGIPEAIGDGGLIVTDKGADFEKEFGNAVIRLLEKPPSRKKLRDRALQFDWDQIIIKQINLYKDVLSNRANLSEGDGLSDK